MFSHNLPRSALCLVVFIPWLASVSAAVAAEEAGGGRPMRAAQAPLVLEPKRTTEPEEDLLLGAAPPSPDPANFEGIWKADFSEPLVSSALGTSGALTTIERSVPPYTAEGANIFWHRVLMEQRGTPVANSASLYLPSIPVNGLALFLSPMSIIQSKDDVVIFFEGGSMWRIHLNRTHQKDLKRTFQGHSVGRWEGATLVVDSTNFNTKTWLDSVGSPHSENLRFITRITKVNNGRKLEFLTTFDDSKMYSRPFTTRQTASWRPDMRMLEVEVENMRPENNANIVIED
jgi:hypothetical protein